VAKNSKVAENIGHAALWADKLFPIALSDYFWQLRSRFTIAA